MVGGMSPQLEELYDRVTALGRFRATALSEGISGVEGFGEGCVSSFTVPPSSCLLASLPYSRCITKSPCAIEFIAVC